MADRIGEVPPGYVVHGVGNAWLVLDRDRAGDLVDLHLADPAARQSLFSRAPRRGRGATPTVGLAGGGSAVLRRYRHGGMLGRLTGRLFLGPGRAMDELEVTARAKRSGAPVPHVLCLAVWPIVGVLWSAVIGTLEEEGAVDLRLALEASQSALERQRLARAVGSAVRRLHDAGVDHRDLQLQNVLLAPGPPLRIVVVDLDRAVFHSSAAADDGMTPRRRARNLGRLVRSAFKSGLAPGRLGRRDLAALFGGYTAGDRSMRAVLRRWATWERIKLALHRWSYPLRSVGEGPSRRSPESPAPPRRA